MEHIFVRIAPKSFFFTYSFRTELFHIFPGQFLREKWLSKFIYTGKELHTKIKFWNVPKQFLKNDFFPGQNKVQRYAQDFQEKWPTALFCGWNEAFGF